MSFFAEQQSTFLRKQIPHPTFELPLTPPSTPPSLSKSVYGEMLHPAVPSSSSSSNASASADSYSMGTSATGSSSHPALNRHSRHPSTPVPSTLDLSSPLQSPSGSLPPLVHDSSSDEEQSPGGSSGIVTPTLPYSPTDAQQLRIATDHSALNGMSLSTTPVLDQAEHFHKGKHPLLPAHRLWHKNAVSLDKRDASPPTTPKGHPLSYRPFFQMPNKSKMYSILSPYPSAKHGRSYTTTLSYLLRIPRRYRPAILLGFCILTFAFVYLSRAMSHATHLDALVNQRRAMAHGRRYIEAEGLMDITDKVGNGKQAIFTPTAPKANSAVSGGEALLQFESAEEELTALIAFVASTSSNTLPPLDPMETLEPSAVLDFDPARPNAREDLELLEAEVNALFPIVLFGKMRDPWHREIKKVLAEYKITPSPLIIDVDQRRDHLLFIPLLSRLLNTTELPQLLVQGKSLGSYHDILEMKDKGTFRKTLEASGAVTVQDAKKKKKGVKEALRMENERILGPKPIIDGF